MASTGAASAPLPASAACAAAAPAGGAAENAPSPLLPLPPPLRGTDGGFTEDSVRRRLPAILDSVLPVLPPAARDAVAALRREIEEDAPLAPLLPDKPAWAAYYAAAVTRAREAQGAAPTWMTAPWFFVETYVYARLLDVVRAHAHARGAPAAAERDPFEAQKAEALETAARAFTDTVLPLVGSSE
jgi:hypothetical protein